MNCPCCKEVMIERILEIGKEKVILSYLCSNPECLFYGINRYTIEGEELTKP